MAANNPLIGKQVGNYRILAEINSGAFGSVYQGKHIIFEDDPVVAIKLLHTSLRSQQEHAEFIKEAQVLKKLNHPHILRILDAGFQDGVPYLVTEYAAGGSLRDRLNKANGLPLALDEATTILTQIGEALHYAHKRHIVHRDLKPENILFNQEGEALLADFGIAILLASTRTGKAEVGGTPSYMAPEQFEGVVSSKSDQYALGCITYELVTGHRLFTIPTPTLEAYWYHHAKVEPALPTYYNPQLPVNIEEAILKTLAKDRSHRYDDILQFSEVFQKKPTDMISVVGEENELNTFSEERDQHLGEVVVVTNASEQAQKLDDSALQVAHTEDLKRNTVSDNTSSKLHQKSEIDPGYLSPTDHTNQPLPVPIHLNRPTSSASLNAKRIESWNRIPPSPQPTAPQQPAARNVTTRPFSQSPHPQQTPVQSRPTRLITRSRIPTTPRRARQPSEHRGRLVTFVIVATLVIILLVGVGFFYYGTTATVTITVPSKTLSLNSLKLVASTNTQSNFPNFVTSQLLTHNASVSGTGTATSSTKATGTVLFTNNSQQNITVLTGTVLSTSAGAGSIQFVTNAELLVPPTNANNSPVPVEVEAQNPGSSGNVGAGTITVIPGTSVAAIAQASNLPISQISLTVTNPNPLTGGGTAHVTAVTQNDLQTLTNLLHHELQAQIRTWLQEQVHQGDIAGTTYPDVLGSPQPLPQEQLTGVPSVGSPLTSKTFSGTLSITVSVLVVRSNNLLAAERSQLNAVALETRPDPYVLATQFPIQAKVVSTSASNDGKTITITMSASGVILLKVNTQQLSLYLTGKTKDQAISAISSGDAGPREVEKVDVAISPSFLGLLPFRSENIHIDVLPGKPLPST